MSKFRNLFIGFCLVAAGTAPALAEKLGLGRTALPEEIAAWNLDVSPDGRGLPVGSGSVLDGEPLFSETCAVCHGEFAEGSGNWPKLAGGAGTLADKDPLKTVGSYWPYLSTSFDYINRSMPFGNAQSLTADEVYSLVAYILYSNDIVDEDFVLSNENFLDVEMPNANGFIVDDRDTVEAHFWRDPCMADCKPEVKITMRAAVLDVTPDTAEEDEPVAEPVSAPAEPAAEPAPQPVMAEIDPDLIAAGEKVFRKCKACHKIGDNARNGTGPMLNGVVGSAAGAVDGFKYSRPMQAAAEAGLVWDDENLTAFLTKPKDFMKGTRMSFTGLKSAEDIAALIAYLSVN